MILDISIPIFAAAIMLAVVSAAITVSYMLPGSTARKIQPMNENPRQKYFILFVRIIRLLSLTISVTGISGLSAKI